MNPYEQQLEDVQKLLLSDPDKAFQQIAKLLKDKDFQSSSNLTNSGKEQLANLMLAYSNKLQQTIISHAEVYEALEIIEKIKQFCPKQAYPFEWGTANCTAGKLYLYHCNVFADPEEARVAAIEAFEEALTVKADDTYFMNWLQAHLYLAQIYLMPGTGINKFKALAILDRVFSHTPEHEKTYSSFAVNIALYPFQSTIEEAKKQHEELASIDRNSLHFLDNVMEIAYMYHRNSKGDEAIIYYKTAKDIITQLDGETSPLYRAVSDNLRVMNYAAGNLNQIVINNDYRNADNILRPFTELKEDETYRQYTEYFIDLHMEAKQYRQASELLKQIFRLCKDIYANVSLLFTYRCKFGYLFTKCNFFTSSLQQYLEASQLYEKNLHNTDLPIAEVYKSIAHLLIHHLRFVKPAKHYLMNCLKTEASLTFQKKAELNLLFAHYYFRMKDIKEAQRHFDLYADLLRHSNEKAGKDGLTTLDETLLGDIYESKGEFERAEICYNNTLQRLQQSDTEEMEKAAFLYLRLGELSDKWKRPDISPFAFYLQGLQLCNRYNAGDHITLAKLQYRWSLYFIKYSNNQNIEYGLRVLRASAHEDSNHIGEIFAIGSEEHRAEMMEEVYEKVSAMLSVCLHYNIDDAGLYIVLYNYVLRRKAINLKIDSLHKRHMKDRPRSNQFIAVQEKLYNCYDEISMAVITNASKPYLDRLVEKANEFLYQKELLVLQEMHILDPYFIQQFLEHENVGSVLMNLPENSVIIEFFKYKPVQFISGKEQVTDDKEMRPRYTAIIGFSRMLMIKLIDVGNCNEIDQLIHTYRQAVISSNKSGIIDNHQAAGRILRERVFDIFLPIIQHVKRIVIAPDGDFSFLPFESLPIANDRYLIDEYVFSYVDSGRDVLSFKAGSADIKNSAPVVMGNPKFSVYPGADLLEGEIYFNQLTHTQKEIEDISMLLNVHPISLEEVSKEAVLKLKSPKFLHLATHGYNITGSHVINEYNLFYKSMFFNGLCLSGINDYLLSQIDQPILGNGFLSAVNVLNMDLTLTELVVLSACDAGSGLYVNGEGVLGLRRAFGIAGAKSIIMSLWKVPDKQTALLMHQFYKHLLNGEARVHALRKAQLSVKSQYNSPIYWGGFVCSGIPSKIGIQFMEHHSE